MVRILAATTSDDRFDDRTHLDQHDLAELQSLVRQVLCGSHLLRFAAELVLASHGDRPGAEETTRRYVRYGASARAGQAIILGAKARALLAELGLVYGALDLS